MNARKTVSRMIPQLIRTRERTSHEEVASRSSRRNPAILPKPPTKSPKCRRKPATTKGCKFVPFNAQKYILVTHCILISYEDEFLRIKGHKLASLGSCGFSSAFGGFRGGFGQDRRVSPGGAGCRFLVAGALAR